MKIIIIIINKIRKMRMFTEHSIVTKTKETIIKILRKKKKN